jgi:PAS domain S-box-containing protein
VSRKNGPGDLYQTIFDEVSDAIFVYDPTDGTVVDVNTAATNLTGYSREAIVGNPVSRFSAGNPDEIEQAASELVQEADTTDQRFEWKIDTADGAVRTTEVSLHRTALGGTDRAVAIMRDISERIDREQELQEIAGEYRSLIENVDDAIFFVDVERTGSEFEFTYIRLNSAHESATGLQTAEVFGQSPTDVLGDELGTEVEANYRRCVERGEPIQYEETLSLPNGELIWETQLAPVTVDGGISRIIGIARDITERVEREKTLRSMYEIGSETDLTFDEKVTRLLEVGREYLDLPYGFFTSIEDNTQTIVQSRGSHELLQPDESVPLEKSYCRKTIESDGLVGLENAEQVLGTADPAYNLFDLGCYIGTKVRIGTELYGTFCFAGPDSLERAFSADEQEIVKLLGQWAGYELEQSQFEARLRELHGVAQELLVAEDTEDVASIAVEAGRKIFGLRQGAFWEYDVSADVLRPLAETAQALETVGETPTFERADALVWESFDAGEIRTFPDLSDVADTYNEDTPLRSEVHVPLGDQGVMIFSSTESHAFDDIEVGTIRLLGVLVREGLIAAEREEQLVARSGALQRQNERLEEFASLVAHDLRNPLTGAISSLEVARETNDPEWFERTEQSLWRMNELVDELLAIARGNRQGVVTTDVSLPEIVEEAWSHIDAPDATLTITDDTGAIRADETRLLQLFGNLFRNSFEHAGEDVSIEVGPLTDGNGFYIADDGPGLPEDVQEAVREYDEVGTMTSGGIGLVSVVDVADAHGWDVSVSNTDDGVRFEIRTD